MSSPTVKHCCNHNFVREEILANFPEIKIVNISTTPLRQITLHQPQEHHRQLQQQAHPQRQHPQEEALVHAQELVATTAHSHYAANMCQPITALLLTNTALMQRN